MSVGLGVAITRSRRAASAGPPPDTTAPGQVTNLALDAEGGGQVDLVWTAQGDDGATGTAAEWALMRSNIPITNDIEWDTAGASYNVGVWAANSVAGGTPTGVSWAGQPAGTWHYAVRYKDEAGNVGPISNSLQVVVS